MWYTQFCMTPIMNPVPSIVSSCALILMFTPVLDSPISHRATSATLASLVSGAVNKHLKRTKEVFSVFNEI